MNNQQVTRYTITAEKPALSRWFYRGRHRGEVGEVPDHVTELLDAADTDVPAMGLPPITDLSYFHQPPGLVRAWNEGDLAHITGQEITQVPYADDDRMRAAWWRGYIRKPLGHALTATAAVLTLTACQEMPPAPTDAATTAPVFQALRGGA